MKRVARSSIVAPFPGIVLEAEAMIYGGTVRLHAGQTGPSHMFRLRSQAHQSSEFVNVVNKERDFVFHHVCFEHGREAVRAVYAARGVESCYVESTLCEVAGVLDGALVVATLFDQDDTILIGQIRCEGYIRS